MNFDSILIFIYHLINNGIKIWVENEKIQLFVPNSSIFTVKHKNFINRNKIKILNCLKDNQIYSVKQNDILILKTKSHKSRLSFAQERLWFIERYEEGSNAYNIPIVFSLFNDIKLNILENSIKSVVHRHEVLRTLIKENSHGRGYQFVLNDKEHPLEIARLEVKDQLELDKAIRKEINHIYDLSTDYPIRVSLYKIINNNITDNNDNGRHYLIIVIHHIAFDGWSLDIFLKELQEYYSYYLDQVNGIESKLNLPDLSIQYKDFALWQRSYLSRNRLEEQLNYWKKKLDGYETLNLISDKPRPSHINYEGRDIYFEIDEDTSKCLREVAKELKVSLYTVLLSGYYLMLRIYSNQDDIVLGTAVANRHYSQIENLIGFFVNSLVLRTKINSKNSIKEFIQNLGNEVVEAQLYQDLPFEKLIEELKVAKDTSRHPIFQVMFGIGSFGDELSNSVSKKGANLINLLEPYKTESSSYNVAKFDLSTFIDDSNSCLRGGFNYATSLYVEATVERFIETYIEILRQISKLSNNKQKQEKTKITELRYLTKEQSEEIIYNWNDTDKDYPNNKTIQRLFEEQVEQASDKVAVVYNGIQLTYKELNERANQLAHYIQQIHDIRPDTLIALCLDRSEHMIISILAVLKAGGAYVPISPSYPDERIRYILEDTHSQVTLTNGVYLQKLKNINKTREASLTEKVRQPVGSIISIDDIKVQNELATQSKTNLITGVTSTNLAYVIYTSGTTGNPKGVMIEHNNVIRLFSAINNWYNFSNSEVWTLFHSYVFDFSVWEIWGALTYGSKLVIPSYHKHQDLNNYYELCKQEQVTVLNQTPSVFYQFAYIALDKDINNKLFNLKYVIFGGEALNVFQLKSWCDYYGYNRPKLINMYGITETTVHVTYKSIEDGVLGKSSCIGKIIPDLKAYVLNSDLIPLPIGAIGELYIGGPGLARGYLNRPGLTAERFINNPFQTQDDRKKRKNARIYKTGDLVRWLPNGDLEYIGRNDFQVKVRGYRIELEEIESVLSRYEKIGRASCRERV